MAAIGGAVELTEMLRHYRTKGKDSARLGRLSSQTNGRLLLWQSLWRSACATTADARVRAGVRSYAFVTKP